MRRGHSGPEQDAVSRRLALLGAELATVRSESGDPPVAASGSPAPAAPATHTRIPADRLLPVPTTAPAPSSAPNPTAEGARPESGRAGAVPEPGRHASRRGGPTPIGLVPSALRGRLALGPAQLTVVAVGVAVALAVSAWWIVRADPEEVPVPAAATAPETQEPLTTPTLPDGGPDGVPDGVPSGGPNGVPVDGAVKGTPGSPAQEIMVHVAGKVHRPGIAVLAPGARVVDAIEAAGGARRGVDVTSLNLARPLVDGEQILVGSPAPTAIPGGVVPTGPPGSGGEPLVNINTANQELLETLPGIGPVTAVAILDWRTENGGFTSVAELLEVDGIGDVTLADIAPLVTL